MSERGRISPRHWLRRGEIWRFYGRIAFFRFSAEAPGKITRQEPVTPSLSALG